MSSEVGLDTHIQDVLGVLEYEDLHDVCREVGRKFGRWIDVAYRELVL